HARPPRRLPFDLRGWCRRHVENAPGLARRPRRCAMSREGNVLQFEARQRRADRPTLSLLDAADGFYIDHMSRYGDSAAIIGGPYLDRDEAIAEMRYLAAGGWGERDIELVGIDDPSDEGPRAA